MNEAMPVRTPASIFEYEGAEDEQTQKDIRDLSAALTSSDKTVLNKVKQTAKRRLDQILKRSAAAAALMNDFDQQLESQFDEKGQLKSGASFDLQALPVYTKLQRTRELIEAVEWRLATVYAHLWKLAIDPEQLNLTGSRAQRAKTQAHQVLDFIHEQIAEAVGDVRVLGLMRIQHYLQDISESLEANGQKTDARFVKLADVLERLEGSEQKSANLTYREFIDAMKTVTDKEYEAAIKNIQTPREPQNNVLVSGFRNTTGSEFATNTWVLTFDDGPHTSQTLKIAGILKEHGAGGDFFWLSNLAKNQPGIVKSVYDAGFGVASHSMNHADLTKLNANQIKDQVSGSRDVITKTLNDQGATNYRMKDFRCPYGACWAPKSQKVQQGIVDAGLRHVYWTVDTLDWQDKNTQTVLNRTLKQMKASRRGIILFHDIHAVAGNVLPLLFKDQYVKDNNLKFLNL